jgi:hypothetical protein
MLSDFAYVVLNVQVSLGFQQRVHNLGAPRFACDHQRCVAVLYAGRVSVRNCHTPYQHTTGTFIAALTSAFAAISARAAAV